MKILTLLAVLVTGCAHVDPKDPLKNSKKLIIEGHKSLYENGAFQIPMTKVKLIPEGPQPINLAMELMGVSARTSFLAALNDAKDSVFIVADGTKKTFKVAKNQWRIGKELSKEIAGSSSENGQWIIEKSSALSKKIIGAAYELPAKIKEDAKTSREAILKDAQAQRTAGNQIWQEGKKDFVLGYLALPERLSKHTEGLKKEMSVAEYTKRFKKTDASTDQWSHDLVAEINGTIKDVPGDTSQSIKNAKDEFAKTQSLGPTLATIKAIGWFLHGLVWEGALKPLGKLAYGGVGYVFVNGMAYPAMLVADSGVQSGRILVEIGKVSGGSAFEIVAPTAIASVAAVLSAAEYTVNGAEIATAGTYEYIGVPLAEAGVVAGGTVSGVFVRGGGLVAGKTVDWGGQMTAAATGGASGVTAGATAVGGMAGSAALGTLNGLYEVGKATVVPPSLELTGGLVLSYGTMSQLAAHTILASTDASYLVLSMEGPSFVIYAIKGKVSRGDDIRPGTVVNLEQLRKDGEEISKVPVSKEEMQKLLQETVKEHRQ